MPSVPFTQAAADAFNERWQEGERPASSDGKPAPKDSTTATASVWDARANILGAICVAHTPQDIARLTGQLPEIVAMELCRLESEGMARRVDGLWQLVRKV